MERQDTIPCAACQSWNRKQRKFTCNPSDCKQLTAWLSEHAPQLSTGTTQMQVQLPEIAIQYVV
jgi:hypothetical protein